MFKYVKGFLNPPKPTTYYKKREKADTSFIKGNEPKKNLEFQDKQMNPEKSISKEEKPIKKEFSLYRNWWLMSIIVFLITTIISFLLIQNLKYSFILGLISGLITILKNPKRRFNAAFWAVFGVLVSVNYFSINLIVKYLLKTDDSNLDVEFSIKEPSIIFSIGMIILLIVLSILDYKEGKE